MTYQTQTISIGNLTALLYLPIDVPVTQYVVGVHGFGSDAGSRTLTVLGGVLAPRGAALIAFDLPCHGKRQTEAHISLSDCLDTVCAAFDYAFSFGLPTSVFATSFGAYLTLLTIAKKRYTFAHVMLKSPAVYMDDVLENVLLQFHHYSLPQDLDATWRLGIDAPVFADRSFLEDLRRNRIDDMRFDVADLAVMQGMADDVVSPADNLAFFRRHFGGHYTLLPFPEGGHSLKTDAEQAQINALVLSTLGLQ